MLSLGASLATSLLEHSRLQLKVQASPSLT
jgi:hypothetical protein